VKWVGLLKNTLRPNVKKGIKRAASLNPAFIGRELGRTVEKYTQDNVKKESQKSSTSQSCFHEKLGRTVEKYSRPNTKKGITKEQHITQSLLS
jgi:hypothetical protein